MAAPSHKVRKGIRDRTHIQTKKVAWVRVRRNGYSSFRPGAWHPGSMGRRRE